MVIEEVKDHREAFLVDTLVAGQLFVVLNRQARQHELRHLREDAVIVILANGKVDVVARNHVLIQLAELLQVLPLCFVDVTCDLLASETVP